MYGEQQGCSRSYDAPLPVQPDSNTDAPQHTPQPLPLKSSPTPLPKQATSDTENTYVQLMHARQIMLRPHKPVQGRAPSS